MINVEIVYVAQDKSITHLHCQLQEHSTVLDALTQSGILHSHPEVEQLAMGIFAKPVTPATVLYDGARLEIYRALLIDPKEKRRQRASVKN